jgi:hypothetical protein
MKSNSTHVSPLGGCRSARTAAIFVPLVVSAAAGCVRGTDPTDLPPGGGDYEVVDGELAAPIELLTGVRTFVTSGDARIVAIADAPDAAGEARLVEIDVRDHVVVELDRMPATGGRPQIVVGRNATAWGFGPDATSEAAFRALDGSGAHALDFGTHAPSMLLGQFDDFVIFASAERCTLETIDLATSAMEVRTSMSCFLEFVASRQDSWGAMWVRVETDDGVGVGMIDAVWPGEISYARTGMSHAAGPVTTSQSFVFAESEPTEALFYAGETGRWPVELTTTGSEFPFGVDALVVIDDRIWGAGYGSPGYLYSPDGPPGGGIYRFPLTYTPVDLRGLHARMIALLADGTLLEQPVTPVP